MNDILKDLIERYGYNEPIFTDELKDQLNLNPNTFRQTVKRLSDSGKIKKVQKGIYFIPKPNSVLKNPTLSVEKIIKNKFINKKKNTIGYETGIGFANKLNLTTQNPGKTTIVTNETTSNKREVKYYNRKIVIKKPRVTVSSENYKILQVLDLLNDFDRLSVKSLDVAGRNISKYLKGVNINKNELNEYLNNYPDKTKVRVYQSGVFDEFTQR